jgi:uncharacterized protein
MEELIVVKKNHAGEETWRYNGNLLQRTPEGILLEAFFDRADIDFHGILIGTGDRFVEAYFTSRWYNIFEIRDRLSDAIKGYYCNVTCPAEFSNGRVEYVDLALDVLVYPDGHTLLLDEDEFAALEINEEETLQARKAVEELHTLFSNHPGLDLEALFQKINEF